jgi:hypothetical protein
MDSGYSANAEDLTEHAGCGCHEEFGHHQGMLGDVQVVEHWPKAGAEAQ